MSCRSFFFFQNSEFWLKITLCGFISRYEPFFIIENHLQFGDHVLDEKNLKHAWTRKTLNMLDEKNLKHAWTRKTLNTLGRPNLKYGTVNS
jgi:hypothetical protein